MNMARRPRTVRHLVLIVLSVAFIYPGKAGDEPTTRVAAPASSDLTMPALFDNDMVLQRDKAIPVWGWGTPSDTVTVEFAGTKQETTVKPDGSWQLALPAQAPGVGQVFSVSSRDVTLVYRNVAVGDVWICSGQSNMARKVTEANNAAEEMEHANYPQIRLFFQDYTTAIRPQDRNGGQWKVCTPETVGGFSAVGYYFGRELHRDLHVPIGLIYAGWGGTPGQAWVSAEALRRDMPRDFDGAIQSLKERKEWRSETAWKEGLDKMCAMADDETIASEWIRAHLDATWSDAILPREWWRLGYPDFNGMMWFRKEVNIPPAWKGKDLLFLPGPIGEVDTTWVNGVKIGGMGDMRNNQRHYGSLPRKYIIPADVVSMGRASIAIRVMAQQYGGLRGGKVEDMKIAPVATPELEGVSLAGKWKMKPAFQLPERPKGNSWGAGRPTVLFNSMIHPLIPYAIKGVIWYQGESNAYKAVQYRTLLKTLIRDWRTRWNEDFPFLIVQLANFYPQNPDPEESQWADLREAQTMACELPKVGLAVTIDIGDATNPHPGNKQDVGKRLALSAEHIAYGLDIPWAGPVFKKMTIAGNQAIIEFDHVFSGLKAKGDKLKGFAIAGEDGKYVWADAALDGDNRVVVTNPQIAKPVNVRYAWASNPLCNLYNKADLPAVPFRTDSAAPEDGSRTRGK